MRGRVAVQARKRLAVERAAQRLASGLAAMCRAARRDILSDFPDGPDPLRSYQLADRAALVATLLQLGLSRTLARGLTAIGSWSHLRTARLLTQWTRGTLAVRKPTREDWLDDLLGTADDYARLLIDPPSADLLRRIVGPAPDRLTRLVDPQDAARVVLDGISMGRDRRQIGADLETLFGGWESAARRVARTEGLRAATEMQLAASEEIPGLVIGYAVSAVLDQRTRESHRKRSGTIYYRNPKPGEKGFDQMPRPPIEPDGTVAFNCLLPGNYVQGRLRRGYRAVYRGEAVKVTTRAGVEFTATVNHPVLTEHGFVPAGQLRGGDDLVAYRRDNEAGIVPDYDHEPATAEDVFVTFAAGGDLARRVPVSVFKLYGDEASIEGDVDVVSADRLLGDDLDPASHQPSRYQPFFGRDAAGGPVVAFMADGRSLPGFDDLPAAGGGVGHPFPLGGLGVSVAAKLNACLRQPLENDGAGYPQRLGDCVGGLAVAVAGDDGGDAFGAGSRRGVLPVATADSNPSGGHLRPQGAVLHPDLPGEGGHPLAGLVAGDQPLEVAHVRGARFGLAAELDVSRHQRGTDVLVPDAELLRELKDRFPGRVAADQVVSVERFHYAGPVYDFESDTGYFATTGVRSESQLCCIVANCRCFLSPVFPTDTPDDLSLAGSLTFDPVAGRLV